MQAPGMGGNEEMEDGECRGPETINAMRNVVVVCPNGKNEASRKETPGERTGD